MECGTVDEARPVIPRVKILGWESLNRRKYLPESVNAADYDDINVNLNHPDGPNKQRIVQERFGWFENISKEADGVYGDLHYNPKLSYAEAFAWWAKHKPSKIGMSHDAVGAGRTESGVFIVEKVQPKSVDLVADSATTKGLFESMDPTLDNPAGETEDLDSLETHIKNAVAAICGDKELDLKTKVKKIKAALKLLEEPGSEEIEEEDDEEDDEEKEKADKDVEESVKAALALPKGKPQVAGLKRVRESIKSRIKARIQAKKNGNVQESLNKLAAKNPAVKQLVETVVTLKAKDALRERVELAHRLCEEAKLPSNVATKEFLETLVEAKDEAAMKKLIGVVKSASSIQKPRSTGPILEGKGQNLDNKAFAKAIRE